MLCYLSEFYLDINARLTKGFTSEEKDDLYHLLERLLENGLTENRTP